MMPWIGLVPSLSSDGLLSSSGVSCSFDPYIISRCLCGYICACLGGGVHISWETCLCINSWICVRFSWRSGHHNPMQCLFLIKQFLPIRLLSLSSLPGSWGDVKRDSFQHIWCQNHPILRKMDGAPFMVPDTRCCGCLVISLLIQTRTQQVIGEPVWLR